MNIQNTRKEYMKDKLSEKTIDKNPFLQFEKWYHEAAQSEIDLVNAMTLATANKDGFPSARIVLLKEFDERGFVFFTNYNSRKANNLKQNNKASLLLFWKELERQIRIEGTVENISSKESDDYFLIRPEESRISAIVSRQSEVVPDREYLEKIWNTFRGEKNNLKRPSYWGGYRLKPVRIEFWQGRENRLHDRLLYTKTGRNWKIERLAP